jgi:hypothetical protein
MRFLPIVVRELRAASRRWVTYWIRSAAALSLIVIGTWVFLAMRDQQTHERSQVIFAIVTGSAVLYGLISGVRDTADCLSWEKREGTLGLLFLTDLKGYDVVLGKLVANSLNAFYGMAAVVPLLGVPLLMGGITLGEFGRTALVAVNTLFFSLALGMLISSLSHSVRKSAGTTFLLLLTLTGLFPATGALLQLAGRTTQIERFFLYPSPAVAYVFAWDVKYKLEPETFWWSLGLIHGLGWLCLALASLIVPHAWQDRPAGVRKLKWRERWKLWSHGNSAERLSFRRKLLDVNAFLWLAARDRLKPTYVWAILGLLGCGWVWGLTKFGREWLNSLVLTLTGVVLNVVIKTWFAAEAGRQLAEDRRRGALELLLSTPLTVRHILRGQLLALQRQFLGPIVTVLVVGCLLMLAGRREFIDSDGMRSFYFLFWIGGMLMLVADLIALYWVGMWQALTAKNPNRAASASVAQILILPGIAWAGIILLVFLTTFRGAETPSEKFYLLLWFGLGLAADIAFGLWARQRLLAEFRFVAVQRYTPQPGFWKRLLGGS